MNTNITSLLHYVVISRLVDEIKEINATENTLSVTFFRATRENFGAVREMTRDLHIESNVRLSRKECYTCVVEVI